MKPTVIIQDEIINLAERGLTNAKIAERYNLTSSEVEQLTDRHFETEHLKVQREEAQNAVFQRLISQYREDIAELTLLLDTTPDKDYDIKAQLIGLRNNIRNSLYKVLKECNFLPKQTVEKELSGWERMMEEFAKTKSVKLQQTIEIADKPNKGGEKHGKPQLAEPKKNNA
jgi:hypothetical protein